MIKNYLKIVRNILLIILLFLFLQTCRACFWYPYRIEKYINTELENVNYAQITIPISKEFDKYKVNGAFARIFLLGHNQTSESGNSPYEIYFSIRGKPNIHKVAYINKFKIVSNKNKKYNVLQHNMFPIKLILKSSSPSDRMVLDIFVFPEMIDLDFKNKEEIEIIMEVEVVTKEKTEKKEMKYKFVPLLEEGHTGLIL